MMSLSGLSFLQKPSVFASSYTSSIKSNLRLNVEDSWQSAVDTYYRARCNICVDAAEFIVQLELIRKRGSYNRLLHSHEMPFYLCGGHEYLYEKMRANVELKDYFTETIRENQ